MPWYRLSGGMLPVKSRKPELLNDDSADVSGGMRVVLAATVLALAAKSIIWSRMVLDVAKLTKAAVEVVGKERRSVAGASRHRQNDVSLSWPQRWVHPAALRRVTWILDMLVWRCRARLPHVLVSYLQYLVTARPLVVGRDRFCSKLLGDGRY